MRINFFLFLTGLATTTAVASQKAPDQLAIMEAVNEEPPAIPVEPIENPILSRIIHNHEDPDLTEVSFAGIDFVDALPICPLETMPADMILAVDNLVERIRSSVTKIKATQSAFCQGLQDRMTTTQAQIGNAINYQFVASANISSNANQDKINLQTQQANAVNLLVLTASDMMQHQCIEAIDDRIVVQRLIGTVASLGGLIYGGWQGLGIAAGGQLIANIPLFRSELDRALEIFQKYDEVNERGSFLCLFRQMKKNTCLILDKGNKIINGMDVTLETGAAKTTKDSIDKIRAESPEALHDVTWLREIETTSEAFVTQMKGNEAFKEGRAKAFDELIKWCSENPPELMQSFDVHPEPVQHANAFFYHICKRFNAYQYPTESEESLIKILTTAHWNFLILINYYKDLKKETLALASIAKTWESFKYFANFKKTIEDYQNPVTGNQRRLNYFHLVRSLEDSLAKGSFTSMMDRNYATLLETKNNWMPRCIRLSCYEPILSQKIRQRALIAMIDLCQTLDPTLACLHVGNPGLSDLYAEWKKRCVGPKSQLCRRVLQRGERDMLLKDVPRHKLYFNSLCGA